MSASLGLFRLQQVDRQIDRAQSQLEAIRSTLENDVELRTATQHLEAAEKEHHRLHHELELTDAEVEGQQIKIQQAESSLYGGSVHNPKELQDLEKDIASLKRQLTKLEERELQAMADVEQLENALQEARTELEVLKSRLGDQNKKLLDDQAILQKDLERLGEEREAALSPIAPRMLEAYEALRRQKRGVAVTQIAESACASCGSNLNAALQQSARSAAQIVHCPSCGRILFAG